MTHVPHLAACWSLVSKVPSNPWMSDDVISLTEWSQQSATSPLIPGCPFVHHTNDIGQTTSFTRPANATRCKLLDTTSYINYFAPIHCCDYYCSAAAANRHITLLHKIPLGITVNHASLL